MMEYSPGHGDACASSLEDSGCQPFQRGFAHVENWVFDLDNTLYSAGHSIWLQIDQRITVLVASLFGLDGLSAKALQHYYCGRYGATLRGLIVEDGVAPDFFLDFAHDIDRSELEPDIVLAGAIARLPGRRFIFTSGSESHALKTAAQLGIDHLFDGIFDITACDFRPKPDERCYHSFVTRFGIEPRKTAMFEDIASNLDVPHRLGMTTVLVTSASEAIGNKASNCQIGIASGVDFETNDLGSFLTQLHSSRSLEACPDTTGPELGGAVAEACPGEGEISHVYAGASR
ncbi:putative hydrolase of the HAD superfamily [Bradyrhizobium macuxiense]|uniref:Putative hydrolase of the HAD superfamily n=2 Tax=Bradyrhizobium macuxiense TaxID=1755647 RepID=A0A560KUE8_9BRAD|nr:putative hydrolase of the HAD superfamily [Bradyrhizobium macuxiense]